MARKHFLNHSYGPRPNGYSHVVTSPPGKMIFVSGAGGATREGIMPEDFAAQAENTFLHLQDALAMAGATFQDVVKVNYYLKDLNHLGELRRIRAKYLNMDAPPAATAVQAGLLDGMLLEVELIAMTPE